MSQRLHFDGPMIAGGSAYGLAEVQDAAPSAQMATGIAVIDEVTGGIEAGAVWAVSGTPGTGVTSLVNAIAAHVALDADVVVCNGHVPTRALAADLAGRVGRERPGADRGAGPTVASWYRLSLEPPDDGMAFDAKDLLVVDTWDETWHAAPWPASRAELVRRLRWLRYLARDHNTAILLTARMPRGPSDDALGWMRDAFDDVADVRVGLRLTDGDVEAHVRSRRGRSGRGTLRAVPGGRTTILRERSGPPMDKWTTGDA